jgi:negative regulator of genetic competence, sporulation and motility
MVIFLKIEKIDEKTIRILLSAQDMEAYHITYEQMDYNDLATKRAILNIIQQVRQKANIAVEFSKLFVEAFPNDDGGCILYVNVSDSFTAAPVERKTTSFDTPLVFEFDSLNLLTAACSRLWIHDNHLMIKTSLYLYEKKYRLLLYTYCRMEQKIIQQLQEYGHYIGKGAVVAAFVKEHAKTILSEHAVETIVRYLA